MPAVGDALNVLSCVSPAVNSVRNVPTAVFVRIAVFVSPVWAVTVTTASNVISVNSVLTIYASAVARDVRNAPLSVPNAMRYVKTAVTIGFAAAVTSALTVWAVKVTTAVNAVNVKTAWIRSVFAVADALSVPTSVPNAVKSVPPVPRISFVRSVVSALTVREAITVPNAGYVITV